MNYTYMHVKDEVVVYPDFNLNLCYFHLQASEGDALVLYNSNMARLVFLFKDANVTCSQSITGSTVGPNAQVREFISVSDLGR